MKVLVICQYYYPENFQITPICERLAADGYEVTVLTGLPNYNMPGIPAEYLHKQKRNELINGVNVVRCHELARKKGAFHLALNYVSFYMSSMRMVKKLSADFDLVFVYQLSPVLMGLPGRWYANRYNTPMLLYCCDIWPESVKIYIRNEKNPLFRFIKSISRKIYMSAYLIVAQSNSFIDYLSQTHDIPVDRFTYIPAFSDDSYLAQDFTPEKSDVFNLVFLGNIGIAQNLISVIKAIELLGSASAFKLHIIGDGTSLKDLKKYVSEHSLADKVIFYGRRPVSEMAGYYKLADACLVSLARDNEIGITLPTKVQGYMAAGKAIVGMADGSTYRLISESQCGVCVHSGDIEGLANELEKLIEHREVLEEYAKNSRSYFCQNFRFDGIMKKIEEAMLLTVNTKHIKRS